MFAGDQERTARCARSPRRAYRTTTRVPSCSADLRQRRRGSAGGQRAVGSISAVATGVSGGGLGDFSVVRAFVNMFSSICKFAGSCDNLANDWPWVPTVGQRLAEGSDGDVETIERGPIWRCGMGELTGAVSPLAACRTVVSRWSPSFAGRW